jgi:hypothetical protein
MKTRMLVIQDNVPSYHMNVSSAAGILWFQSFAIFSTHYKPTHSHGICHRRLQKNNAQYSKTAGLLSSNVSDVSGSRLGGGKRAKTNLSVIKNNTPSRVIGICRYSKLSSYSLLLVNINIAREFLRQTPEYYLTWPRLLLSNSKFAHLPTLRRYRPTGTDAGSQVRNLK